MTPSSSILLVAPPAQYGIDSSAAAGEFAWWRLRTSRPASAVARSLPAPGDIISRSRPASAAGCGVERRVRVLVPPTPTRPVISEQELEQKLLAACNRLREPVDPTDYEAYIFPLLFLARISGAARSGER